MNEQIIQLKFPKTLSKLAGNSFGRKTYDEQVKGRIDFSKRTIFVFPNSIDRIASSFVQGFFDVIMREIGWAGINDSIDFQSNIKDFKKFVLNNLR